MDGELEDIIVFVSLSFMNDSDFISSKLFCRFALSCIQVFYFLQSSKGYISSILQFTSRTATQMRTRMFGVRYYMDGSVTIILLVQLGLLDLTAFSKIDEDNTLVLLAAVKHLATSNIIHYLALRDLNVNCFVVRFILSLYWRQTDLEQAFRTNSN